MQQKDLSLGLHYYQSHEYISALKHFAINAPKHRNYVSQMVQEVLIAITNMQLCNYNQAMEQLQQTRIKIVNWQREKGQEKRYFEIQLIKIKVMANILVISLVNCKENSSSILDELILIVEQECYKDKFAGRALFKAIVKSFFGFQSFSQLEISLQKIVSKISKKNEDKSRGSIVDYTPTMLSSLSIYSHLTGNLEGSIILQKAAYDLIQNSQPIHAVLSLRHLQELEKEKSNEKQRKYYHKELMLAMGSQDLDGIAQQTLFRNYSLKIKEGHRLISCLIEKQKDLIMEQMESFAQIAMLWKLRRIRNEQKAQNLGSVIEILEKDRTILQIMGKTAIIKQAETQYRQKLQYFLQETTNLLATWAQNSLHKAFKKIKNLQPQHRTQLDKQSCVIQINLSNIRDQQEKQENFMKKRTPSKGKKHEFASTFYIPTKNLSNFRNQIETQGSSNEKILKSSRLTVKPPISLDRQGKIGNQKKQKGQRQKQIYKIGKRQSKKGVPSNEEKERMSASRKSLHCEQKSLKINNIMDQFIRDPKPPKKESSVQELNYIQPKEPQTISEDKSLIKNKIQQLKSQRSRLQQSQKMVQLNKPFESKFSEALMIRQPQSNVKSSLRQKIQAKIIKSINQCIAGQFVNKRHYSSDGGAQRYLKLNNKKDTVYCSKDKELCDHYHTFEQIKGIIYGKATQVMMNDSNKKLEPWKCFSFVLKKRTLDIYCPQQTDVYFWLQGLSTCLKDLKYKSQKYYLNSDSKQSNVKSSKNSVSLGQKTLTRFYSLGRILWKRVLMRLKWEYLNNTKKNYKRAPYSCANAYAIIVFGVKKCGYKLQYLQKDIIL